MRSLRITAAAIAAFFIGCVSLRPSHPYYLTQPARTYPADSTIEPIVVHVDERTMIWLGAMLAQDRREMRESGACLHLRDGNVDSVYAAPGQEGASWSGVTFHCPKDAAPLHFHIPTEALRSWLQSQGYGDVYDLRCTISTADRDPRWSSHPFNAMSCGMGIDSLFVYRVKAR